MSFSAPEVIRTQTKILRPGWKFFLVAGALFLHLTVAQSATITVISADDSGPGTLRQAILDALPGDTITFEGYPTDYQEIHLSGNEISIDKNLTIEGPRPADYKLSIRNEAGFRVFHIAPAVTVAMSGLTVTGGYSGVIGGGILNEGTLTMNDCWIGGNVSAETGGGIGNTGTLTLENCDLSGNVATLQGGGISNSGTLTITNSTMSENRCFNYGAGILNTGTAVIANCTFSRNEAGVESFNTTYGGGIANRSGGTLTITNSTLSGNKIAGVGCGGGIFSEDGGSVTMRGTLIALNLGQSGPDLCGALTTQGFNLVGNIAGATIAPQPSDQIGTPGAPIDPLLGYLENNGGPTRTLSLQSDSPAVNHGDPNAPGRDQRGYFRANAADVGAFEFNGTIPVTLANIATRLFVQTEDRVLIGGFIVTGAWPKKIMIRAIGPSLPVAGALADPVLELHSSYGVILATNDNWRTDQEAEIAATGIPPSNDLESAIVTTLPAQNAAYTAIVRGVNNGTGIGLVEVYDLDLNVGSILANISTRGPVETGDNVLIAGTIVVGQVSQKVILRAIGPSLNLAGRLENPRLELRDTNGGLVASNDNWRTDQEDEIIATRIPPSNDLESAIVQSLAPSNYTAIVRGVNGATGIAVVEVYALN